MTADERDPCYPELIKSMLRQPSGCFTTQAVNTTDTVRMMGDALKVFCASDAYGEKNWHDGFRSLVPAFENESLLLDMNARPARLDSGACVTPISQLYSHFRLCHQHWLSPRLAFPECYHPG